MAWRFLPLQQCRIFCVALWICFLEHCGDGTFGSADDPVGDRYGRNENSLDFWIFPTSQIVVLPVYFLSGILDHHDCDAGHLFLFCEKNGAQGIDAGIKRSAKNVPKNRKRFLGI